MNNRLNSNSAAAFGEGRWGEAESKRARRIGNKLGWKEARKS